MSRRSVGLLSAGDDMATETRLRKHRRTKAARLKIAAALIECGRLGAWDETNLPAIDGALLELGLDWAAELEATCFTRDPLRRRTIAANNSPAPRGKHVVSARQRPTDHRQRNCRAHSENRQADEARGRGRRAPRQWTRFTIRSARAIAANHAPKSMGHQGARRRRNQYDLGALEATQTKQRETNIALAPLRAEYGARSAHGIEAEAERAGQGRQSRRSKSLADVWNESEQLAIG